MLYTISLYIALTIFGLGLVYRVSVWFRYRTGVDAADLPASTRVSAAVSGIVSTLFSEKVFVLLRVFLFDVLLQTRILKEDVLRWSAHMCMYAGFMLLLLMHALDEPVTSVVFADYYPTLNPFMFLRDLSGAMVILGVALSVYRRVVLKTPRVAANAMDRYAIALLAVIVISGLLLEATKFVSHSKYEEMVQEYGDTDEEEAASLEAFWVEEFALVSPSVVGPFDSNTLTKGKDVHEINCAGCHSRPQWAFMGYGITKILKPAALSLDKAHAHTALWYIHFMACFFGLAYLPFSKFFHMFTAPLSLLANAVMTPEKSNKANVVTRQGMELDACTHCGMCTSRCSVAVILEAIPNINILPSEKMVSLKSLVSGKKLSERDLRTIQEGVYLCTNCDRCTVVCPVGINLKELWFNMREYLIQRGYAELSVLSPLSFYRALNRDRISADNYDKPLATATRAIATEYDLVSMTARPLCVALRDHGSGSESKLPDHANTFSVCYGCQNCTTICPVVHNYDNPREVLGLLPHQIMHAVGLGFTELALGSRMLWECLTCYQCQEHCPQGVRVTDELYELKQLTHKRFREKKLL